MYVFTHAQLTCFVLAFIAWTALIWLLGIVVGAKLEHSESDKCEH